MAKQQHVSQSAHDVSTVPAAKLLQARPFQNEHEHETDNQHQDQVEAPIQSVTGSWDLTQTVLSETSPSTPSPTPVVGLQLQAKLTIGEPNDKYEQEADRVAHDVVQRINAPDTTSPPQGSEEELSPSHFQESSQQAQRQMMSCPTVGGFDLTTKWLSRSSPPPSIFGQPLQAKLTPRESSIQRETQEKDNELQMKPLLQRKSVSSGEASSELESSINRARSGGQALDANLQQSMGQAMGADFSNVKVHTDSTADTLNQSIQAKAFTTGQDVFFRSGEYSPGTKSGQELIAHELTHVVQQNKTTLQRKAESNLQISQTTVPLDYVQRDYYLWADQGLNVTYNVADEFQGIVTTGAGPCVAVAFDATYQEQRALSLAHFDESTLENTTLPKMYQSLVKALKIDDISSVTKGAIQITYHLGGGVTGYLKKLMPIVSDFFGGKPEVTSVQGSLYDSQDPKNKNTAFKLDKETGFSPAKMSFGLDEEKFSGDVHHLEVMYLVYESVEMYKALLASLEKSEFLDIENDGSIDYGSQHYKELQQHVAVSKQMKEDPKTAIAIFDKYANQLQEDKQKVQMRINKIKILKNDDPKTKKNKESQKQKMNKELEKLQARIQNVEQAITDEKKKLEVVAE